MDEPALEPSPAQEISFLSPESFSTLDEYSNNPRFIELQEELRGVLFARASGEDTNFRTTPEQDAGNADDTEQPEPKRGFDFTRVSIPKIQLIKYLKNWIIECAPYLDKFDHARHFAIRVPVIAESSPALFYAVLAFSARQMERKAGSDKNYDSLELYQESISLLAPGMQAKDSNMLVTACILAVMELMSGSHRAAGARRAGRPAIRDPVEGSVGRSSVLAQDTSRCIAANPCVRGQRPNLSHHSLCALAGDIVQPSLSCYMSHHARHEAATRAFAVSRGLSSVACSARVWHLPDKPTSGQPHQCHSAAVSRW